jgi:protein-S-isoprenylcysteine O-methyltransferase Ste14
MNAKSETTPTEKRPNIAAGIARRVGTVVIFLVLQAVILFLASGQPNWTWAWIYLGICVATLLINGTIMLRANSKTIAETIAERGQARFTKDWDKVVSGLFGLALYSVLPLVAGLDVRFGWTPELNIAWNVVGVVLFVGGLGLGAWAMFVNAYFSTAVRIQSERGHTVCHSGPYRLVRHPGYVGFILQSLGTPVLLGSLWALIPGTAAVVFMIIRTSLEDRTLQAELPGYQDFVQEVRYRLVPGIW